MRSVLVFNNLWHYVDGSEVKPNVNAQDWLKKDAKALVINQPKYLPELAKLC